MIRILLVDDHPVVAVEPQGGAEWRADRCRATDYGRHSVAADAARVVNVPRDLGRRLGRCHQDRHGYERRHGEEEILAHSSRWNSLEKEKTRSTAMGHA